MSRIVGLDPLDNKRLRREIGFGDEIVITLFCDGRYPAILFKQQVSGGPRGFDCEIEHY
jgi:L-fucose mutarotase/ribose pyranase (RbsD/FucU family)